MCAIKKRANNGDPLTLKVLVPPKLVQNNKILDAPFKSCFQSASDLNNDKSSLNEKLQVASAKQSHVLDDIQSEKSEELIEIGD
jgi:hypothetical protein